MEKLKEIITQHNRWEPLLDYVNRIEGYRESDFPLCIENAKSLLEAIAKEICIKKSQAYSNDDGIGKVLKLAFAGLGYNNSATVQQISGAIANVGHQMSLLRNEIGATSHGKSLDELEKRKDAINKISSDFLLFSTELVCCFLIQLFESENPIKSEELVLSYDENIDFNESLDDQYGEFVIGSYAFLASEVLYQMDPVGYRTELTTYKVSLNETDNGK